MALSKLSLNQSSSTNKSNQSSTSNKVAKKVTVFHRTEFERTIFNDTALSLLSSRIKGDYEYDVDMDIVPNLILDYMSTPHAQELLACSLINLTSLPKKELPEEFKAPLWEEKGICIISSLSLGCHFFSTLTHDYQITFAYIMSQFITDELWNKLISDAVIIPEFIKKEDVKKHLSGTYYLPEWIDLGAEESTSIYFHVLPHKVEAAFNAVKNSTLPQEIIDDLTAGGTFIKVLTRAGFGVGRTSGKDTVLEGFIFKEVLGKYNEDFLKTIAPFVTANSYIEINDTYKWYFDGATCKKTDFDS